MVEVNDKPVLFQINEAVCNPTAEHSLLSEYQLRDFGVKVNSVARKHGGEQNVIANDQEIPCGVKNCLIYFKCRLPTDEELEKLVPIQLTQGEMPWNPKADEHNSPINDDFNKEVVAAAEADAQAEAAEADVLLARQLGPEEEESKAARIFSCLSELHSKSCQEIEDQDTLNACDKEDTPDIPVSQE